MDTPKPGWTPYVVYTTEILSFLHNGNETLFQTVTEKFKNQISENASQKRIRESTILKSKVHLATSRSRVWPVTIFNTISYT